MLVCLSLRFGSQHTISREVQDILTTLKEARELNNSHYSVWHAWAVANYDQLKKVDKPKEIKDATLSAAGLTKGGSLSPQLLMDIIAPPIPPQMSMPPKNPGINFLSPPHKQGSYHQNRIGYSTPRNLNTSGGSASTVNYLLPIQQVDSVTEYVKEAIKVQIYIY